MKLILFDGVCNLCNGFVQFIIKRDPDATFMFASLQSETAVKIRKENGSDSFEADSVLFFDGFKLYSRSDALLEIARDLPGFKWLTFSRFLPLWIRDSVYELVARNRYRLFGKREECMIPTPKLRGRFLP